MSRFAPRKCAAKPLYRFRKCRQSAQTRIGAPILGNTIGNLVAEGVAGRGRPRTGAGKIAAADGPAGVMSDIPSSSDRATANAIREMRESGLEVTVTDDSPPDADLTYTYGGGGKQHGFGWKVADALGFHQGGFFYNLVHPSTWSMGTNFDFSWSYAASSLGTGASAMGNNFRDDYQYRVNSGIASMRSGWATLNDGNLYRSGDGIAANLNTLKGLGQIAGGAFGWLTSPISAPADTIIGRPISSLTNGAVSPRPAGDTVVAIGSMLVGPEAALTSRTGRIAAPEITQLGGAYRDVKGMIGYEAHHMPANSISPLSTEQGPSVAMLAEDHRLTASWGNSREARAYRQTQADLIAQGDFQGAQQLDIIDIQSKFGNKYDDAIQQMLDYSRSKGH